MTVLIFMLGLVIGSFLNVCIYRIPKGESLVFPSSRCPACGQQLKFFDLVPVASFFVLGGRCRFCRGKISPRYPLVEFLTGCLFAAIYARIGLTPSLVPALSLTAVLIVVAFIDIDYYRIPDILVAFGFALGIALRIWIPFVTWEAAFFGVVLGGGILLLIALVSRGGMGGGDVKLAALIGFFLGWHRVLLTLFLAALFSSLAGITLILLQKKGRKDPIPFGPFLALGAVLSLLFSTELIHLYARCFLS